MYNKTTTDIKLCYYTFSNTYACCSGKRDNPHTMPNINIIVILTENTCSINYGLTKLEICRYSFRTIGQPSEENTSF